MKIKQNKMLLLIVVLSLIAGIIPDLTNLQAKTISLNMKNIVISKGKAKMIKVLGVAKKQLKSVKWSIKSGKKNIKIRVLKNKAKAKVIGKKAGKAEIRCKAAGKKFYCKITVKCQRKTENIMKAKSAETIKPSISPKQSETEVSPESSMPAVSSFAAVLSTEGTTEISSPAPVSTDMETPVTPTSTPQVTARPTHIPTSDKLMAEPAKSTMLPTENEKGNPIPNLRGEEEYYFYGSNILRSSIEVLRFSSKIEVPDDAIGRLDLSEKQNNSVIAWYTDLNNNNEYEMTIAQEGGVIANEDSSYFCCGLRNIKGFENLYTDGAKNMMRAFYQYIPDLPSHASGDRFLDLGDDFETSKVETFDEMFSRVGSTGLTVKIRLGKSFSFKNSKSAVNMFNQGVWNMISEIIVPTEEVAKWICEKGPISEVVVEGKECIVP